MPTFHVLFIGEHGVLLVGFVDIEELYKAATKLKDKSLLVIPKAYHEMFQDMPNLMQSVVDGIKD
jgi:alpha-beta hydrolase superfamily lysophospholipase